jgi:hypothetical protein
MGLFKLKVAVTRFEEIPVEAESEEDALRYAKSTDEWKKEGCFMENEEENLSVVSVERVTSPGQTDFKGDWICWSDNENTNSVAEAFYMEPYPKEEEFENYECYKAACDAYYDAKRVNDDKFDAAREADIERQS